MLLKLDYLCRKNRTMFLKILILDVHRQKNFGNLKGSTPKEQYDYYEKKYLNNATYVKSLLQEYPELKRLLELKNNSIQRAECEIRKSLYAEKEQIQKIFCDGRKFSGTVGIYMSKGDIHRGGRSVAKVELDNGTILYYKPHSLDKNIKYQELYNYLCRKTGISCCRKALLNVIHKEGESSFMKEIHDYEIESLLEMDIPCFEIDANSRSVYDGNGGEHKEYLPCTPYESWRMHMKQMSYSDMECQCDYIRLSMEMLKASDGKKKMFPTRIKGYDTDKERKIYSQIRKIVHRICSRAIIREQSAGWAGLQFWDNGHWNLRSGGIYLYDGISGIVLFLAKYLHDFEEKNASAEEIYHLAVLRLKAYTDEIHKKQIYDKNLLTGIVNGESSVVYTYLYLFKLTGKRVWMIYAEKHFSIIERVWKEDSQLDYLSGNAGAIVVAVMLYKETGNLKYYEIAADMEKDLWKKGQETGNGYGWRLKGTDGPLAGMSHGNSGFMMAYAALYECNHKAEYADKIQLLLRYEDSLYSEKAGNWKDLRESSGESFMNAWCHGAPGILLSRMKLEELFPEDMQIKKDRLNAADSLFYGEQDEKICLCHGMSGNLLIMKKYLRKYGNKKMKEQYEALCDCLLFQLDHPAKISGTEYLNLAFMNGISGTGMALMEIL